MSDIKAVERLEDWFDSVIRMGPCTELDGLARRLPVYTLTTADQPADVVTSRDDAGSRTVVCSTEAGLSRANALRLFFHHEGVRRPLILARDEAFADLLTFWQEPFKAGPGATTDLQEIVDESVSLDRLEREVTAKLRDGFAAHKKLNVLVLYNDRWTHIESTREHLKAFGARSRHNYVFMPAAETEPSDDPTQKPFSDYSQAWPESWDFSIYDAIVWHYVLPAYKSAEGYLSDYIAAAVTDRLARYDGLKVLFVQDEYDSTATIWKSIRRAGINLVMSVVPPAGIGYVYPPEQLPGVEVISTLTGFVPDGLDLSRFSLPMAQRNLRIAYRGRALPYRYGSLGREKIEIGVRMKAEAARRGVHADIELSEDRRIYGQDWYRFLGSARAMLATESGSNVFDFDGTLHATEAVAEGQSFEQFFAEHLAHREGHIEMNQISPKVFEAIALRTALVCFEGGYSGVIQPDTHFITLKKDFSNVDDVLARLEDVPALEAMTERAYRDVIESGRYGYPAFIERFDKIVESRIWRPARAQLISAPILRRRRGETRFEPIVRHDPFEYILNDGVLHGGYQRRQLESDMGQVMDAQSSSRRHQGEQPPADATVIHAGGPATVRCYEVWSSAGASLTLGEDGARVTTPPVAWHYAAGVHLDFSAVDFEHQHCWVRLRVKAVEGAVLLGLYAAEPDVLSRERPIPPGAGEKDIYVTVFEPAGNLLVLRTAEEPISAAVTVLDVQILTASAYHPDVLALARRLAAEGRSPYQ
jgi:hypothetical protein